MVDWIRINQLSDDVGRDAIDDLLWGFTGEIRQAIDHMEQNGTARPSEILIDLVIGDAESIGCVTFAETCRRLYANCAHDHPFDFDAVREALAVTERELKTGLSTARIPTASGRS